MTINLSAIFGPDTTRINNECVPIVAENPVVTNEVSTAEPEPFNDTPWPIVPGTEHWNPYISEADLDAGRWGEKFIPGFHVDLRQPSRLRGLCSGRLGTEQPHNLKQRHTE